VYLDDGYVTDRLVARNRSTWRRITPEDRFPNLRLAIVTCMDCRIDVYGALGLVPGDAHVLRNAGGQVTDDVIRSLVLSQRLLGTREVIVMHHTDCGLHRLDEPAFVAELAEATGCAPEIPFGSFEDLDDDVRASVLRIIESPLITEKGSVRGFVYDVANATLREVSV
jgi:carbonic anhydrase